MLKRSAQVSGKSLLFYLHDGGDRIGNFNADCMALPSWPGGGDVVLNQELHPVDWSLAWVLCLHEGNQASFNLFLSPSPHVSSHRV